jgi:hypothetical protein
MPSLIDKLSVMARGSRSAAGERGVLIEHEVAGPA